MKSLLKKSALVALLCLLPIAAVFSTSQAEEEDGVMNIRFMTTSFSGDPMPNDSELLDLVEDYTGVRVTMEFVPDAVYEDKVNIVLASGDLPEVMLMKGKYTAFVKACEVGAFWDLGPYLKEFPNLADMNPVVLNNASINGKTYGLYRARNLGRNGVIFRADWLKNVGLEAPKTVDDFYNMLYQFTYGDPDQNGKDDTYGMVVCTWQGPFLQTSIWMGAPNSWGDDGTGKLVPAHLTPEFMDAMDLWHKMWSEGLVNEDFPVFNCGDWRKPIISEEAGVITDVLDGAGRWENDFIKADMDVEISMVGRINDRTMPTSGYSGMFAISKDAVETEAELRKVLAFMDKLNDPEMQDLLGWGIEGRHWLNADGFVDPKPVEDNPDLKSEINDANQMLMFINGHLAKKRKTTDVRTMQDKVMVENEAYVVGNPAEPIIPSSETYALKGSTLDTMIKDGYYQYIVGELDKDGWNDLIAEWRKNGGDDLIKEINELYQAIQ